MVKSNEFLDFERLFWQVSREMSYLWKSIYEQTFPGSQSHILFLLERHGAKKMSDLANTLHLTAGAVTTASDQLIKQNYITRVRDDNDRRVVYIDLTEKGQMTLNELKSKGLKISKTVFNDISASELEIMTTVFERAILNMDTIRKEFDK